MHACPGTWPAPARVHVCGSASKCKHGHMDQRSKARRFCPSTFGPFTGPVLALFSRIAMVWATEL
eukprot:scaffold90227_cov22-Tisochrysis_lutea.AAC.2